MTFRSEVTRGTEMALNDWSLVITRCINNKCANLRIVARLQYSPLPENSTRLPYKTTRALHNVPLQYAKIGVPGGGAPDT